MFASLGTRAHTWKSNVCIANTEEDQTGPHDHGTIDDVLGDQDTDELMDTTGAADEAVELLEQMHFLGHPESRLANTSQGPKKNKCENHGSQDGTLQLISTTLIASLGHLQPYVGEFEKNRSIPDPLFWCPWSFCFSTPNNVFVTCLRTDL